MGEPLVLYEGTWQPLRHHDNGLSDFDNEGLYIPIAPSLSEESTIPMIADEDAVDHITKNPPQCDRSHGYAHGAAPRT